MKLETTLETLDDLPEELRENYVEGEDGKYRLGVLDGFVPKDKLEDTSGLKSALQKERENAKSVRSGGSIRNQPYHTHRRIKAVNKDVANEAHQSQSKPNV